MAGPEKITGWKLHPDTSKEFFAVHGRWGAAATLKRLCRERIDHVASEGEPPDIWRSVDSSDEVTVSRLFLKGRGSSKPLAEDATRVIRVLVGQQKLPAPISAARWHDLETRRRLEIASESSPSTDLPTRHYAPLTLVLDRDGDHRERLISEESYSDLAELLRQTSDFPALVILGPSGAGKTTILKGLEKEATSLDLWPLLASLREYEVKLSSERLTDPMEWLEERWNSTPGRIGPSLSQRLREGRVLLLLDAVNEIRGANAVQTGIGIWGQFLRQVLLRYPGNRAVLTCRQLEYTDPLPLGGIYVPTFRVQPLAPEVVTAFVKEARPDIAPELVRAFERDRRLLSFYRNPYFLTILLGSATDVRQISSGGAQLFSRYVWSLLREELPKSPAFFAHPLFSTHDRARINLSGSLTKPTALPDEGYFVPFLTDLAFQTQEALHGDTPFVHSTARGIRALAKDQPPEAVDKAVEAACALSILEKDLEDGSVRFYHELLREFFAARRMAEHFDPTRWRERPLNQEEPSVPAGAEDERLGPMPSTGWEETTIMAAGLASDQATFVEKVFQHNTILAARCVASDEVSVPEALSSEIQRALVDQMRDPKVDLRARFQAGLLVTDLTKLGFQWKGEGNPILLPPLSIIPDGDYWLGGEAESAKGLRHHANTLTLPLHKVHVASFAVSAFPVTNAEFALFIRDGGYENEALWEGEEAKQWRLGETSAEGNHWQERVNREIDREWGPEYLRQEIGRRWSFVEAQERIARLDWPATQFEAWLREKFPSGIRLTAPNQWDNAEFTTPSQPVADISWFEANAYCRWLSIRSGLPYRLLSELEYEAASGGLERRTFSYGSKFDPTKCNVFATRIWRPSPVGLFSNATPEGVYDLTGNVWTWTSSIDVPTDDSAMRERRMVTRGGSYDTAEEFSASICRDSNHPGYRDRYIGLRLALDIHAS